MSKRYRLGRNNLVHSYDIADILRRHEIRKQKEANRVSFFERILHWIRSLFLVSTTKKGGQNGRQERLSEHHGNPGGSGSSHHSGGPKWDPLLQVSQLLEKWGKEGDPEESQTDSGLLRSEEDGKAGEAPEEEEVQSKVKRRPTIH